MVPLKGDPMLEPGFNASFYDSFVRMSWLREHMRSNSAAGRKLGRPPFTCLHRDRGRDWGDDVETRPVICAEEQYLAAGTTCECNFCRIYRASMLPAWDFDPERRFSIGGSCPHRFYLECTRRLRDYGGRAGCQAC